jgi:hypothetical protein
LLASFISEEMVVAVDTLSYDERTELLEQLNLTSSATATSDEIAAALKSLSDATLCNPLKPDSYKSNPNDDRVKLFVDATGIVTKELIADYITALNSDEITNLKTTYGAIDSAMLIDKITA